MVFAHMDMVCNFVQTWLSIAPATDIADRLLYLLVVIYVFHTAKIRSFGLSTNPNIAILTEDPLFNHSSGRSCLQGLPSIDLEYLPVGLN